MVNLILNFTAEAAIAPFRIVKYGSSNTRVVQSSAAADGHVGVCSQPAGSAINRQTDVTISGRDEVECGGTIAPGDLLTSDAIGRAVKVTAAAGVNIRTIGIALNSGVIGDVITINIDPGPFQG